MVITTPRQNQKILFLHIDALPFDYLEQAMATNMLPGMTKFIKENGYFVDKYFLGVPSITYPFQAKLFFNDETSVPCFRWYNKKEKLVMSAFVGESVARLQKRLLPKLRSIFQGIIILEGSFSPGNNTYSLTTEALAENPVSGPEEVADIANKVGKMFLFRTFLRLPLAIAEHSYRWLTAPKGRVPWQLHPFAENIYSEEIRMPLFFHQLKRFIKEGFAPLYFDFSPYDHTGHMFGPWSKITKKTLAKFDKDFSEILKAAKDAGYLIIIFSDHGLTESRIFRQIDNVDLAKIFARYCHLKNSDVEIDPNIGRLIRTENLKTKAKVFLTASGSISLAYFTDSSHRLTDQEVKDKFPDLIPNLLATPGIGLVGTKTKEGYLIRSSQGEAHLDANGMKILKGESPLKKYDSGEIGRRTLFKWLEMTEQGDIVIMGDYDGQKAVAFEDHVGCHGGLGGLQNWPFYCGPKEYRDWFVDLVTV